MAPSKYVKIITDIIIKNKATAINRLLNTAFEKLTPVQLVKILPNFMDWSQIIVINFPASYTIRMYFNIILPPTLRCCK